MCSNVLDVKAWDGSLTFGTFRSQSDKFTIYNNSNTSGSLTVQVPILLWNINHASVYAPSPYLCLDFESVTLKCSFIDYAVDLSSFHVTSAQLRCGNQSVPFSLYQSNRCYFDISNVSKESNGQYILNDLFVMEVEVQYSMAKDGQTMNNSLNHEFVVQALFSKLTIYYAESVGSLRDLVESQTGILEESKNIQKEQAETSKGILSSITDFFGSFFDNLIQSVISVIVPSSEEMSVLFGQLNQFFSDTFGFLYYPFDFLIRAFNVFLDSDSETGLTFPSFSIMGHEVWGSQTYDIGSDDLAGSIFQYVRIGTGALLSLGFVDYLRRFFDKRFGGGGS